MKAHASAWKTGKPEVEKRLRYGIVVEPVELVAPVEPVAPVDISNVEGLGLFDMLESRISPPQDSPEPVVDRRIEQKSSIGRDCLCY